MVKSGLARRATRTSTSTTRGKAGTSRIRRPDAGATSRRARDAKGEILTNANFPDMKGLVDYIHGHGLKAGIYSSPGPTTCQGLAATYQHEEQDARTWAKWGFDYLKYDWCSYQRRLRQPRRSSSGRSRTRMLRAALNDIDRDIDLQPVPVRRGQRVGVGQRPDVGGNLWRMTGDIRDTWASMSGIGFQQTGHEKYAGPGHWNDTDMLVVGMVGWSQGIAADESHAERAAHAHLAVGAAGGAAADRRRPVADRRVDDEPARQSRSARGQSGCAREAGGTAVERRLDGRLGAPARGRHDGRRALQSIAGARGDDREVLRARLERRAIPCGISGSTRTWARRAISFRRRCRVTASCW